MEKILLQFLYYKKMVSPLYVNKSSQNVRLVKTRVEELAQTFLKLWLNEEFSYFPLLEPRVIKTSFF